MLGGHHRRNERTVDETHNSNEEERGLRIEEKTGKKTAKEY